MLQTPEGFQSAFTAASVHSAVPLLFNQGNLLVRADDFALPEPEVVAAFGLAPERWETVGLLYGKAYQTSWLDGVITPPHGHLFLNLRSLFGHFDNDLIGIAARAVQIAEWARTHQYCGACATPMQRLAGERARRCPACGHQAYPRISPAMMVLIRRGEQVLLASHGRAPGRFTALAGFLEAGESVEDAIHREVMEEVGLRVHKLRYFASQSWPFPHSLMLAFTAEYLEGEIRVDGEEIVEARWFGPGDAWPAPVVPPISVASLLIDAHRPPGA